MYASSGLTYDPTNSRLFATDYANNRVLVFNLSGGISNDMPASYVLGQPNFTTISADQGGTATSSTTMYDPYAIAYNSTHSRLFVDDDDNHRLLLFSLSGGITNDMPASYVLGQLNFTSTSVNHGSSVSSTTIGYPEELAYDPNNDRLFVGDNASYQVLVFNLAGGLSNDMPASAVFGTTDFTSSGTCDVSRTEICDAEIGMLYDTSDNRLWMTDDSNERVLAWDLVKVSSSSLPSGTVGASYSSTLSAVQNQGTLTWSITSGSLPAGLSLNVGTGVISGTPAAAGTSSFTVEATDDLSSPQTFTDQRPYPSLSLPLPLRHQLPLLPTALRREASGRRSRPSELLDWAREDRSRTLCIHCIDSGLGADHRLLRESRARD